MSYRFVDSFRAGSGWNCSYPDPARKLSTNLVGLIVKKFVTMHGDMNVKIVFVLIITTAQSLIT